MVRLASIDIGSNAMRLEICDVKDELLTDPTLPIEELNKLAEPGRIRIPVRLGYETFLNGFLSENKLEEVQAAFEYFKYEIIRNKVDYYQTAATSASREAVNGAFLAKRILEKTGILFRIIDGIKESQLLNLALFPYYDIHNKSDILVDLGGGSLEINVRDKGTIYYQDSLPIGTVRLMIESNFNEDKMVGIIHNKLSRVNNFFTQQF